MKKILLCIIIFKCGFIFAANNDPVYEDGRIKYVLHPAQGRFSLYYMTDVDKKKFEPLFWDRDKMTSFLAVIVGNTEYKLGDASVFKIFVRGTKEHPVLSFESTTVAVSEEFSFIRTASSGVTNGIRIDIKIENWGEKTLDIGARILIDTFLGEKITPSFRTNLRPIDNETIVLRNPEEQWWVSRGERYGLMGSISVEGIDMQDYIMFANWKRLYGASFRPEYVVGRNFNSMLYSARDSAVCYYLDKKPVERWGTRKFTVLLAAEDQYGFDIPKIIPQNVYQIEEVQAPAIVYDVYMEEPVKEVPPAAMQPQAQQPNITAIQQQSQQPGGGGGGYGYGYGYANPYAPYPYYPPAVQQQPSSPNQSVVVHPPAQQQPTIIQQPVPAPAPAPAPVKEAAPIQAVPAPAPVQTERARDSSVIMMPIGPIRVDLQTLRALIYKVDEYIYFGTPVSEEELRGMEMTIARLRARYGIMWSTPLP